MKVYKNETEEKIINALTIRCASHKNEACLQIKGRFLSNEEYETFPEWISAWLGNKESEIFLCEDKDVFIFSPYINHNSYIHFKKIFQGRFFLEKTISSVSFYNLHESSAALIEAMQAKIFKRKGNENQTMENISFIGKDQKSRKFFEFFPSREHALDIRKKRSMSRSFQVLIVEDDEFSRRLIAATIGDQHQIIFAEDGLSALANYLSYAPDIVFLDINLPDVTGHDVLIKILSVDPDAYAVMLSGNSNIENVKYAMSLGAKGFVGKPFNKEKLLNYISKAKDSHLMKAMV